MFSVALGRVSQRVGIVNNGQVDFGDESVMLVSQSDVSCSAQRHVAAAN